MNPDIKSLGFMDIMSDSKERTEETHEHSEPKNATQEQSSAKEILNSSSPMKKPKSHILDPWKKPYKSWSVQQNEQGEMLVPLTHH